MTEEERSRITRLPRPNQFQMPIFQEEYDESTLRNELTSREPPESRTSSRETSIRAEREPAFRGLNEIESIYHHVPVGLCVLDRNLRYVHINQLLAKENGIPADRHIGKTVREIIPDFADAAEEMAERIFLTGEPMLDFEMTGIAPGRRGLRRHWKVSWLPIRDNSGNVIGINGAVFETTDKKNAELNENFLTALVSRLSEIPDAETIITETVRSIGEYLGVTGCHFCEADPRNGLSGQLRQWRSACLPEAKSMSRIETLIARQLHDALLSGKAIVSCDTRFDPRISSCAADYSRPGIAAFVLIPSFKDKSLDTVLAVSSASPRKWLDHEINLVKDALSRILPVIEQARAKQELREREERLRMALRGARHGTWDWNLKTRVMVWDERCKEIFGFEGEEPVTYEWHIQHLHPDDRQIVAAGVVRSLSERIEFEKEYRTLLPDGKIRWVLSCGHGFWDEAGIPCRMSGTVLDITERKRVEEELRENEERLNLAIHCAGMGTLDILLKTGKGVWSENNFHLFGYDREPTGTVSMEMWLSRVHPEDLDNFLLEMEKARKNHALFAPEYRVIRAGTGEVAWISLFGRFIYDPEGEPVRFVGVFFNSTERKTMEEELRIAHDKLEQHVLERTAQLKKANLELQAYASKLERMNRDLQDFAFVASHDLQEPLRTIQTFCTRIEALHGETLCHEVRDSLRRVAKSATRMRDLIAGMYLYHRATQKSLVIEETDLDVLMEEVLLEFQEEILEAGGIVELGRLPVISAEAPQMRRLFQSLIANSLKFRRPGVPPVIRICSETEESSCRISVSDNGIGFDEKHLNRIFKPFQRLHGRDEYEGAGMGLTICRKVVENHQGTITTNSTPGEGATFLITLPIRPTNV